MLVFSVYTYEIYFFIFYIIVSEKDFINILVQPLHYCYDILPILANFK